MMATYEDINLRAYEEARRDFRSMMLHGGYLYETALEKRQEVYDLSRRSRCTACGMEKHVTEFCGKTETTIQSWCRQCSKDYVVLKEHANV